MNASSSKSHFLSGKPVKNILTIVLFYLINFLLWDVFVSKSMPEEWASFTVYLILFIIIILLNFNHLKGEFNRLTSKVSNKFTFLLKVLGIIILSYIAMSLLVLIFDKFF